MYITSVHVSHSFYISISHLHLSLISIYLDLAIPSPSLRCHTNLSAPHLASPAKLWNFGYGLLTILRCAENLGMYFAKIQVLMTALQLDTQVRHIMKTQILALNMVILHLFHKTSKVITHSRCKVIIMITGWVLHLAHHNPHHRSRRSAPLFRSPEMLENEDMHHLLRLFSMQGNSSVNGPDDGFSFPSFAPSPLPNFSFDEDQNRPVKAVVGWLKIKAAMIWGFFIRKKAAERRAKIVQLDDD